MVGAWLLEGWRRALHVRVRQAVEGRLWMGLRFPMVGAGLESGWWMVGEMVVKRLWLRAGGRVRIGVGKWLHSG